MSWDRTVTGLSVGGTFLQSVPAAAGETAVGDVILKALESVRENVPVPHPDSRNAGKLDPFTAFMGFTSYREFQKGAKVCKVTLRDEAVRIQPQRIVDGGRGQEPVRGAEASSAPLSKELGAAVLKALGYTAEAMSAEPDITGQADRKAMIPANGHDPGIRRRDMRGADLHGALLKGMDLAGADLRDADLSDADLTGADLTGADLREAILVRADLSGANLSGADLSGADLSDAELYQGLLIGARLVHSRANSTNLAKADLSDADLRDSDLTGASLNGANLRNAILQRARLREAYLVGTILDGADLAEADLTDSERTGNS